MKVSKGKAGSFLGLSETGLWISFLDVLFKMLGDCAVIVAITIVALDSNNANGIADDVSNESLVNT